jgi:hypothetical protein
MKFVITYDVNVDALEEKYRIYLTYRKQMLEYYEEIGNPLKKEEFEKNEPWVNFEEFIKTTYFNDDYDIEELEDYELIYNPKIELKNEEEF